MDVQYPIWGGRDRSTGTTSVLGSPVRVTVAMPLVAPVLFAALLVGSLVGATESHASCNAIPAALSTFRSALGSSDRPFAMPGDWIRVGLDPICHASSPGFGEGPGDIQVIATLIFKPPREAAPRHVVVVTDECNLVASQLDACEQSLGRRPLCFDDDAIRVLGPSEMRVRLPEAGSSAAVPVADLGDDLTLTGPLTIAVTGRNDPLPCQLVAESCPLVAQDGLRACIDRLFVEGATCSTAPDATFGHFTALPVPNSYEAICEEPSPPCSGRDDEIRFTVDTAGNALIPMDWSGILVDRDAVPVPRFLRASSPIESFAGRGSPLVVPSRAALSSYSPEGIKIPPIFEPQYDATELAETTLFGTADAALTVLRIARQRTVSRQCASGPNVALPCIRDEDCNPGGPSGFVCGPPSCFSDDGPVAGTVCASDAECGDTGTCGPPLFDFSDRLARDVGPVVVRRDACFGGEQAFAPCSTDADCPGGQCGDFGAVALDPTPLDGLIQTPLINAFVKEEAITEANLNGDEDEIDHVVTLADRSTGITQQIGEGSGPQRAVGRAVVRSRHPPFSFPAVAVEGDLVAFLEPEILQFGIDANGNGLVFDNLLRVFRLGGSEVGLGPPRAVDAMPIVSGRALAVSRGRVFVRRAEAAAARRRIDLVSITPGGMAGNFVSAAPSLSSDGRYVAFESSSDDLVPQDTNGKVDVFIRDLESGTTELVTLNAQQNQGNGHSFCPALSADGRYVAFQSMARNLAPGVAGPENSMRTRIFVRDRQTGTTEHLTAGIDPLQANEDSECPVISADGRFVAFASWASNLVAGDANQARDIFVYDREDGSRRLVSRRPDGGQANGDSFVPVLSADGSTLAFASRATDLSPDDAEPLSDIFVVTLESGSLELISRESALLPPERLATVPQLSSDGRLVGFVTRDSLGGFRDLQVFVHDRERRTTEPLDFSGEDGMERELEPVAVGFSRDFRYVAFYADAGGPGFARTLFLHDRATGLTRPIADSNVDSSVYFPFAAPGFSDDGSRLVFESSAGLLPADQNFECGSGASFANQPCTPADGDDSVCGEIVDFATCEVSDPSIRCTPGGFPVCICEGFFTSCGDVYVEELDVPDPAVHDLFPDGRLDDVVLEVLDTGKAAANAWTSLCPAEEVAVAKGRAVFLRPEAASGGTSGCPSGSLNGDPDATDRVVQLWRGGGVENLGLAASKVAISDKWIAALASESEQGARLNPDLDTADGVLHVRKITRDPWRNLGVAATRFEISGSYVAFLASEAAQGVGPLNDDQDTLDEVVHVYDAASGGDPINLRQAAEELVIGKKGIVAFRTLEAKQGAGPLNGDGDTTDGVLQIWAPGRTSPINTGLAVTPCALEACDPRVPYRVGKDTVTFLSFECEQGGTLTSERCPAGGTDFNDDGDPDDLVLQVLNVRQLLAGLPAVEGVQSILSAPGEMVSEALHVLAATATGVCTTTAEACVPGGCGDGGICFVPPGGCVRDTGIACNPAARLGEPGRCEAAEQFCQPTGGGGGTCRGIEGACRGREDCSPDPTVECNVTGQNFQRIANPLAEGAGADAGTVLVGSGRCVELRAGSCVVGSDCARGEFCDGGECFRERGLCRNDSDCAEGSICRQDLLAQTAADTDGDEVPDFVDNCPEQANVKQVDRDSDKIGDACDPQVCGNGKPEPGELCDDGNQIADDGCDCTLPLCGGGTTVAKAKLTLKRLGATLGDEMLTLTARLLPDAGSGTAFDLPGLIARGAQLLVEDLGAESRAVVDLSRRTAPIPPGVPGSGCDPLDGWTHFATSRRTVYVNRSDALPELGCVPGSAQGLRKLVITEKATGRADVTVKFKGATLVAPRGPLRATLVLGLSDAEVAGGACGSIEFVPSQCRRAGQGKTLRCR